MEKEKIIEKLTIIFRTVFNDDTIVIRREMTTNDVENWSSLTHLLMINEVETLFEIKIFLREINKLKNVGNLIDLIEVKTA